MNRELCGSFLALLISYLDKMGFTNSIQRSLTALVYLTSVFTTDAAGIVTLLGYGSFIGTVVDQSLTKKPLSAPVDAWLGIDYASQPTGQNRFAPVGPPAPFTGTKNASQYGLSCIQDPASITYELSEACLSMNVFRPQNISLDEKLPVLIWIHGVSGDNH